PTLAPVPALLVAAASAAAGLPENVLVRVTGKGSETGDPLVTHPAVRMISFTGGLETGTDIAHKAGLKKLRMELGSNSPTIVLKDAELAEAVESCVSGAYGAVGQNCIGVQRIFVERPIYNEFVERFAALSKEYTTGDKKLQTTK